MTDSAASATTASVNVAGNGRMRTLWLRMAEIYGHRWTSAYGEDADKGAGDTWAKGLAGISPKQIAEGLSAALVSSDPWPPTLPQFRAQCLGIPSLASVLLAIHGKAERTPFARLVWSNLDSYRLRTEPADKAERMIRDAYELAREHVMAGAPLPAEPTALIEPPAEPEPRKAADPAVARQHMANIAAMLGMDAEDGHDAIG